MPDAILEKIRSAVGPGACLQRPEDLEPYLKDFRGLFRGRAALVVIPASTQEVSTVLSICHEQRIGVVPQGGNTSYCGAATPDASATQIVLAMRRMNRIRRVQPLDHAITVEAGCVLAQVQEAAEAADRLFPLSLGSEGSCQIGGNLATNAGGTAVLRYGMVRDLVLGLEVVLADGRVLDGLKCLRKDNTGYDLRHLFIGSEGTLGVITAACLKLFPRPLEHATAIAAVTSPGAAVELLSELRAASGDAVSTFELIPRLGVELTSQHVAGVTDPFTQGYDWYVLIELTSSRAGSGLAATLEERLADAAARGSVLDAAVAASLRQREALWRMRETIPEAQRHAGASIKHDVSVPISSIAEFIERGARWIATHVPEGQLIAYGHLGDGNLHFNIQQRPGTDAQAFLAHAEPAHRAIHDLAAGYGGSFSAEHGIGQLKIAELQRYKDATALELMRQIKQALDPHGILNPGKVLGTEPG
ncbi:MAG TPA: FAD-binding oxidoreductase [Steroidobacteraceae bacterium]|nr:FAD-binding oxidoreductase [Steroidobacteraceae bacterium]